MKTNKNSVRRSLIVSATALVLTVAMLIGTTFAWFTDSVTSGRNRIQAGNLDVELTYKKNPNDDFKEVTPKTNLFNDSSLWEPGHVEYVVLNVHNAGTLALKYNLNVTVNDETKGTSVENDAEIQLSKFLQYAAVPGDISNKTRAEMITAAESNSPVALTGGYAVTDKALSAKSKDDTVTLVVWMPETVGNAANYKKGSKIPTIEMGVTLVATQYTEESDSFDEKYDDLAVYPVLPKGSNTTVSGTISKDSETTLGNITASGTAAATAAQIVIPEGAVTADTDAEFSMQMTESTPDSVTYEISLTDTSTNESVALSSPAKVTADIGKNLMNVVVKHSNVAMTAVDSEGNLVDQAYYYDRTSGLLIICTSSFSPFEISYEFDGVASVNGIAYASVNDAINAAKSGDTVVLMKDASGLIDFRTAKNVTLDLNGKTFTGEYNATVQVLENADATIKNGTIKAKLYGVYTYNLTDKNSRPKATLDNVKIEALADQAVAVFGAAANATVTIKNCDIKSNYFGVYQNGSTGGNTFVIENTTITDIYPEGLGVYISNTADNTKQDLTITNSTITGDSAVEMKHTNATITDSTLVGRATPTASGSNNNGTCSVGYALAATTNGVNELVTGTVNVSGCKFYSGTTTEGDSNGYVFVYKVAEGSSVTIDGNVVSDYNTYGGETNEQD